MLNILTATTVAPTTSIHWFPSVFNRDILAENANRLAVLFDLHPSLSNLQSAHHAVALLIPKQLLKSLKCFSHSSDPSCSMGDVALHFQLIHMVPLWHLMSLPRRSECSDNCTPRTMIITVLWRAVWVALGTRMQRKSVVKLLCSSCSSILTTCVFKKCAGYIPKKKHLTLFHQKTGLLWNDPHFSNDVWLPVKVPAGLNHILLQARNLKKAFGWEFSYTGYLLLPHHRCSGTGGSAYLLDEDQRDETH